MANFSTRPGIMPSRFAAPSKVESRSMDFLASLMASWYF